MIEFFSNLFTYFVEHSSEILTLTMEHLQLTLFSMVVAILIGVPIGILISYVERLNAPLLGLANVMQAIPSLALLGFLIPFLGIGQKPAIFMIVVYSLLPIIKNTSTGLDGMNSEMLEAASGIGMTPFQILWKIKLPMALPVIMAGVRISAVASVGLVTIAAFIGAGGLGYLVYAGIRTMSTHQILAGAIPAALIALIIDWYMEQVENAVTPISLQDHKEISEDVVVKHKRQRKRIYALTAVLLTVILVFTALPWLKGDAEEIVLGTKGYTEQEIVGEMLGLLIEENTDLKVVQKRGLGSTGTILDALKNGSLDVSVDYTGTIFGNLMNRTDRLPQDEVYKISSDYLAEHYGLASLAPIGFNNTNTLTVTKETAKKYNLKTFSDLAENSSSLRVGCNIEFLNRLDGLPGLTEAYGFEFKSVQSIDASPRYIALLNNDVQVIDAYSTDALVRKHNLVILEDDKNHFPAYYAFPLIRQDLLEEHPEIGEAIELLANKINDEEMAEMNYRVDELGEAPADVAKEYLASKGILKKQQ